MTSIEAAAVFHGSRYNSIEFTTQLGMASINKGASNEVPDETVSQQSATYGPYGCMTAAALWDGIGWGSRKR